MNLNPKIINNAIFLSAACLQHVGIINLKNNVLGSYCSLKHFFKAQKKIQFINQPAFKLAHVNTSIGKVPMLSGYMGIVPQGKIFYNIQTKIKNLKNTQRRVFSGLKIMGKYIRSKNTYKIVCASTFEFNLFEKSEEVFF